MVDEGGRTHEVVVPEGMMSDVVRPHWEERVRVSGALRGKEVYLEDISSLDASADGSAEY